jgi:hypothetical protein
VALVIEWVRKAKRSVECEHLKNCVCCAASTDELTQRLPCGLSCLWDSKSDLSGLKVSYFPSLLKSFYSSSGILVLFNISLSNIPLYLYFHNFHELEKRILQNISNLVFFPLLFTSETKI